MIAKRRDKIGREFRILYNLGNVRDLTDGQLLERFATDVPEVAELAFSALVERHAPLVWRVCLAIVRDEHQAEDAFQATFLVLVRKARSLWVQDSLGPWLHQVAYRTASCVRTTRNRRLRHERRCAATVETYALDLRSVADLDRDAVIHEELNRLPVKFRAPLILCDLEGRTHQEAARFLGWPIGTVKSRQSHARGLIRARLAHRGVELILAAAVTESLKTPTRAAISRDLSGNTVRTAMEQAGRVLSPVAASASALSLTQGVLRAMIWIRIRTLVVAGFALGMASAGAEIYGPGPQEPVSKDGPPVLVAQRTIPPALLQTTIKENATEQSRTATPQDRLREQRLATRKAKIAYEIAKLTRELAELNDEEYRQVGYPQDLAARDAEIIRAESELAQAAERGKWADRMFEKGFISKSQKVSDGLALQKAEFSLQQAVTSRKVLVDYTKDKTAKALRIGVEKARADELDKQAAWEREKTREVDLERRFDREPN